MMTPEELENHKALLARMGMTYTEPYGPTDMAAEPVQKRMREVAAAAKRVPSIFNEQNDFDLGNQVRMLTRTDSGHEGVVCAARDRIFQLSLQVAALQTALRNAAGAISSLDQQIGQMRGMFDDEDGQIEEAVEDGDASAAEIRAVLAAYADSAPEEEAING